MGDITDFHVHVFPDLLTRAETTPLGEKGVARLRNLRRTGRKLLKPFSQAFHQVQPSIRHLPEPLRRGLEEVGGVATLPGLLFESSPEDLLEAMDESGVERAIVIASPPACSNELVLELAAREPRFVPAVNIPAGTEKPGARLKGYARDGAKFLKIHAAVDGEGPKSPRYRALLGAAEDLGLPVILHTGCIRISAFYKDPEQGHVERFVPWFQEHPGLKFILAHMNFHLPGKAMDIAEDFPNLVVDTSWQPAETIAEAVRRLGADRVLFGSDWPLAGHNMSVGIQRIRDCESSGEITAQDAEKILSLNAKKFLGSATGGRNGA